MNITLQELADASRVYLDDDHKDTEGWLAPAAWIRLANTEYVQHYRRWVRMGLISPAPTDVTFTTPTQALTGVLAIVGVAEDLGGGRYREIEGTQSRVGRAPFWNTDVQSKPISWQASGTGDALTISLNPQGSGNYVVRYIAQPTRATALTDVLVVPDGADERLILGMTRRAHLKDSGASALLEKLINEADAELAFTAFGRSANSPRVRVLPRKPSQYAFPTDPALWRFV